jgi:hypothetical protein
MTVGKCAFSVHLVALSTSLMVYYQAVLIYIYYCPKYSTHMDLDGIVWTWNDSFNGSVFLPNLLPNPQGRTYKKTRQLTVRILRFFQMFWIACQIWIYFFCPRTKFDRKMLVIFIVEQL